MHSFAFLTGLLSLASAASISSKRSTACNNSPDLCSRAYNNITHLGAHDSPFVRDASTGDSTSGNQFYNSTVQLDAGVRLLSAQVHKNNNAWHLCHSSCDLLDAGLLSSWLQEIKTWLDNNPNDVVTVLLVNSDNATPSQLDQQFQAANITSYAYTPADKSTPPQSWPTLQTLIDAKTRLMVFVASLDPSSIGTGQTYLMDEFTFIFENPYDNTSPSDFTCSPDRPTAVKGNAEAAVSSDRMAFMNHFLYQTGALDIEIPNTDNITFTNSPNTTSVGELGATLNNCTKDYGKAPTFTLVDFFDQGPAIDAVDNLNGITPVGRKSVPARDASTSTADSSFAQVNALVEEVKGGQKPVKAAWIWASGKWTLGGINMSGGNVVS